MELELGDITDASGGLRKTPLILLAGLGALFVVAQRQVVQLRGRVEERLERRREMPDSSYAVLRLYKGALDGKPAEERPELHTLAARAKPGSTEGQSLRRCSEEQHS